MSEHRVEINTVLLGFGITAIEVSYVNIGVCMTTYGPVTHSRTGSTYIPEYKNIVSCGKIISPSNLGDGLHTGTYLQRKWAGCHEQGTNIKRVNQPYVTE